MFAEDEDGRFGLTPAAAYLRTDTAGSRKGAAVAFTMESFWRPYGHLMHSVMTGEPAFDHLYGTDVYDYMRAHPDERRVFQDPEAT